MSCVQIYCKYTYKTTTITKLTVYKVQEKWLDISKYCKGVKLSFINQEKSGRLSTTGGRMRMKNYLNNSAFSTIKITLQTD